MKAYETGRMASVISPANVEPTGRNDLLLKPAREELRQASQRVGVDRTGDILAASLHFDEAGAAQLLEMVRQG